MISLFAFAIKDKRNMMKTREKMKKTEMSKH